MDIKKLIERAKKVRQKYSQYERKVGKEWSREQIMEGLVGDVGDLMKLVMAKEGYRKVDGDLDKKLAHELSDCLWVIFILSDKYGVDLEKSFIGVMDELDKRIESS